MSPPYFLKHYHCEMDAGVFFFRSGTGSGVFGMHCTQLSKHSVIFIIHLVIVFHINVALTCGGEIVIKTNKY